MALPIDERPTAPTPAAPKPPVRSSTPSSPRPSGPAPTIPAFDPSAVRDAREILATAMTQDRATDPTHGLAKALAASYDQDPTNDPMLGGDRGAAYQQMAVLQGAADPLERHQATGVAEAQTMLEDALRAQRERAIGADQGKALHKPIAEQTDRMTLEEYEALSPIQRAAVDFNGMLVQAVRKDRHNQDEYKPTDQQREIYDMSVEKMFGEDGGSKLYAPETLGVLRQIEFTDQAADLDDFLGLKAAIDEKDLGKLELSATPPAVTGGVAEDSKMSDVAFDRVSLARNLATSTQTMQSALVKGNELLQSLNAVARLERNDDVTRNFGGIPNQVNAMPGYGPANFTEDGRPLDLNSYYQLTFDKLARPDGDKDEILGRLNTDLQNGNISAEEFEGFFVYADNRSGQAARYGVELGQAEGVKYRKPEEFRKILGLGKEAPDGD